MLKTLGKDGKEGSSLKMLPGILRTGAFLEYSGGRLLLAVRGGVRGGGDQSDPGPVQTQNNQK